jgi:hypothetical protein
MLGSKRIECAGLTFRVVHIEQRRILRLFLTLALNFAHCDMAVNSLRNDPLSLIWQEFALIVQTIRGQISLII